MNDSLENLRSQMGILLYEQDLFDGTLYENITLGKTTIGIDDITALIKKIGFDGLISYFPKSFDSTINPLGKMLPSSIIKKILLLRALINDPLLIVLEEPWLGLNEEAKIHIQKYLLELASTKTIIISCNDLVFSQKCTHHIHLSSGNTIVKK